MTQPRTAPEESSEILNTEGAVVQGAAWLLPNGFMFFLQDDTLLKPVKYERLPTQVDVREVDYTFDTMADYHKSFFAVAMASRMERQVQVVLVKKK